MIKNEYREKYNNNVEVLKKLNIISTKTKQGIDTGFDLNTIESAISKIEKEQEYYTKQLRKYMCDRFNKKITFEKKSEIVEKENKIDIQNNSIDEHVSEAVEQKSDDKTEVLTNNDVKTCDNKTEVLTSDNNKETKKTSIKKKNMFNKLKVVLANVAAASLLLIGGIGISGKLNKDNKNDKSDDSHGKYTTEDNFEETTTKNIIETTTYNDLTEEKVIETKEEKYNTDIKIENKDIKNDTKTIETKDEKEEFDLRIGDTVSLENVDLYSSSTDLEPSGNTSNLDCNYEVSLISVVYQNQVVDLIKDDSVSVKELEKNYEEKYGDDIQISCNFNPIDSEKNTISNYVGWTPLDEANAKIKVLK